MTAIIRVSLFPISEIRKIIRYVNEINKYDKNPIDPTDHLSGRYI